MIAIRGVFVIRGILCSFSIISRLSIFLTLSSYVYFGNVFTSRQVFVVTSSFNFLYDSMLYFWTVAVTSLAECFVSMMRIQDFLLLPEENSSKLDQINLAFTSDKQEAIQMDKSLQKQVKFEKNSLDKCVIMKNVTALWNIENHSGIIDFNLEIYRNQFVTISGPVASGKSTILFVILRELEIKYGELIVNGVVSYSSQEPWLFDATVRQNIIFTEQFDNERYLKVIRICGLENDIRSLAAGDFAIVGESGICLSGGQKSRINLARAIYQRADIYLLDDPLSAVDTVVGKFIFNHCIRDFLKDKICILVTHQTEHLKASNRTIFIDKGKIQHQKHHSINENYNLWNKKHSELDSENSLNKV